MGEITPAGKLSFIRDEHDLQPISNKLRKLNSKAIAVLENNLSSDDPKIQIEAAKLLLKFEIDISKIINEDTMQRLLLELKQNGNEHQERPNNVPLVDFSNIQDV